MKTKYIDRMKKLLGIASVCLLLMGYARAQTVLQGKVIDYETGEPLIAANVAVYSDGLLVAGDVTDYEGSFRIPVDPGTYEVEASYLGYQTMRLTDVVMVAGKILVLDFKLKREGVVLKAVEVKSNKPPIIDKGNTTTGRTLTAETIQNLPSRGVNTIVTLTAGATSQDGGSINIKGSRSEQTVYYLDDIRVTSASMIPSTEIDQLQVLTGGIGAEYGDLTGGVIAVTSKGPRGKFKGGLELETSQFLDPYGYNLANMYVTGPILKRGTRPLLGFRAFGQFLYRKESDPPAGGIYAATEETINDLSVNPLIRKGGILLPRGEFLSLGNGVEFRKTRPNQPRTDLDLGGKLFYYINDAMDLTLSGTYSNVHTRFVPRTFNGDSRFNYYRGAGPWYFFNWPYNPEFIRNNYTVNVRFRHRLGAKSSIAPPSGDKKKPNTSLISNASYTIHLGYEQQNSVEQDARHKDKLFNYGYVGKFDRRWDTLVLGGLHIGYQERLVSYEPAGINPILESYNQYIDRKPNLYFEYNAYNGEITPLYTTVWNVFSNVTGVYNRYQKRKFERYTGKVKVQFDLIPFGISRGVHNIVVGGQFEQRVHRLWSATPMELWRAARILANQHIGSLDTLNIVAEKDGVPIYGLQIEDDPTDVFAREVRKLMFPNEPLIGDDKNGTMYRYVNTDILSPDDLSLSMFSPRELSDLRVLYFYGYDHLGNETPLNATFEDFFKRDENGVQTFTVAPYKPIYGAFFLQDRFNIGDIIFRFGVRVDYFDANQKVLKDKYSLYPIMTAADFHSDPQNGPKPPNVGDDFKVYLAKPESNIVLGYRDGDTWYDADGRQLNSGRELFGEGGLVLPAFLKEDTFYKLESPAFNPDLAFKDYDPQVNVMPRLGFSFPISDEANFFAHYDVLVSRPYTGNIATAYDYFYFTDPNRTPVNNPDLKPEKMIDYEVGFQQKITDNSAIKLSMYYREFRNQIQLRNLLFTAPEPISSYILFDNIDFGTSKGLTVEYELRRTGNVQMLVSYTLGFAEGTGSDEVSQRQFISRGFNIRTLSPLTFDERHRLVMNIDYRYGSGKQYTGPELYGMPIFENTGLNIQFTAASGRPYTKAKFPGRFSGRGVAGQINGARLPANYTVDAKLDRRFTFTLGGKKKINMYAYLRVNNLFDTRNILGVYSFTGSPKSDGYFSSVEGQNSLAQLQQSRPEDVQYFIEMYKFRLHNPNFYSLPRRIRLGFSFSF